MEDDSLSNKSASNKYQPNNIVSDKQTFSSDDNSLLIVKIISIYEYTIAGFGIVFGLILLFGGQLLTSLISLINLPEYIATLVGAAIFAVSILLIAFSIFTMFLAKALTNHKNWARVFLVVCSCGGAIAGLLSFPTGIIGLLINAGIVYFLGFNDKVKALFR